MPLRWGSSRKPVRLFAPTTTTWPIEGAELVSMIPVPMIYMTRHNML
jgi:hypothetical protein